METGETTTILYPKAGTSYNSDAKEIVMDDLQRKQIVDSNDIENRKTTATSKDVSGQIPSDPNDGFWSGRKTGGTIITPNTIVPGSEIKNNDIYGNFTVKEDVDKVTSYENFWAGRKGIDNVYDPYANTQGYSSNGDMSSNYQDVVAGQVSGYSGNSGGFKDADRKYKTIGGSLRLTDADYDYYIQRKGTTTKDSHAFRDTTRYGKLWNGMLPKEILYPVSFGKDVKYFSEDAAKAFDKLVKLFMVEHAVCFTINDGYRTFSRQVEFYKDPAYANGLAAFPGTSKHGWGVGVDINISQQLYNWLKKNATPLNIIHPTWASDGKGTYKGKQQTEIDKMFEPWHWEYNG